MKWKLSPKSQFGSIKTAQWPCQSVTWITWFCLPAVLFKASCAARIEWNLAILRANVGGKKKKNEFLLCNLVFLCAITSCFLGVCMLLWRSAFSMHANQASPLDLSPSCLPSTNTSPTERRIKLVFSSIYLIISNIFYNTEVGVKTKFLILYQHQETDRLNYLFSVYLIKGQSMTKLKHAHAQSELLAPSRARACTRKLHGPCLWAWETLIHF